MNKQPTELVLAGKIYDLDTRIYEATGSTLGKVYPAVKAISVNLIVKHLCYDKNHFLRSEMILLKNMLKPLEGTDVYAKLLAEYDALVKNLIVKHLCYDKNHFLRSEMILLKNMLKPLEGTDVYAKLLAEYDALVKEIEELDVDAVFFRSGLEAISGNCPVIPPDKKIIICISRQYGCRGQDIGVSLAKRTGFPYFDKDILAMACDCYHVDDKKIIICISRQYGCRGQDIGVSLAKRTGFPYFDKDILAMACDCYHVDEASVSDYNSAKDTINSTSSWFPKIPKLGSVSHDTLYFKERGIIQDIAEKNNAIILGRCADHILDKLHIPHISIYLCAPLDKRIQVEMARSNVSASLAKKTIQQVDRSRQAFYKYYTGRTWGNPEHYNACLNTAMYGVKGTVSLIENMMNMRYQGWE